MAGHGLTGSPTPELDIQVVDRKMHAGVHLPTLAEVEAELARRAIHPHPGDQQAFVQATAEIVIAGGAAGGGKTAGLLLAALGGIAHPAYRAVIFRRTYPQITAPGGLWQQSERFFPPFGGLPRLGDHSWRFPSGANIRFGHMQNVDDWRNWKGAEMPFLGFDQLEEFEAQQVWNVLAWNRSAAGIPARMLATCNPVPEEDPVGGWLHRFVAWWLGEDGRPDPIRVGRLRWFMRDEGGEIIWTDTPGPGRRSVTFIPAWLENNPSLRNTAYRTTLSLLPLVERERLLGGNWLIRATAGNVFNRGWFQIVDAAPVDARRVRFWDKAGTEGAGDFSAGVRLAEHAGSYYVEHVIRGQWSAQRRNQVMRQAAEFDGVEVPIWVEREGGSGGKESAEITVQDLAGWMVRADLVTGSKLARAGGFAAQAEAGNIKLVRGQWNEAYLAELHSFPDGAHDDQVDASSGAFNKLALGMSRLEFVHATPQEEAERQRIRGETAQKAVEDQIRQAGVFWPGR